jgi:tetratricopeptide (TPR) repeat protein
MKSVRAISLTAAVVAAGCAGRLPEPRPATMVRSFHGTLVPGYYVSPGAYQHYIQAQLLSNDGRTEDAVDELRRALASDGASPYLRTRLAEELLTLGRVDEAREEVEAALHLDPQFPEAYVDLARVRLRLADAGGAQAALERALAIDVSCEDAYVALAAVHQERGDRTRVEQTWRDMAHALPQSAHARFQLGRALAARGEVRAAEAELVRAVDLDPGAHDARIELAELLQGDGRADDAAAQLEQAWSRTGDLKDAERLVRLQVGVGRGAAARELIDHLEDEGGGADRRLELGWMRLAAGQSDRTIKLAEELLRNGESGGARLLLGAALEDDGRADAALAQLKRVPPQSTHYAAAQQRIGRLLSGSGRYREAIDLLARAIGTLAGDESDPLHDLLARVHERAGDASQALRVLETALKRRPQSEPLALSLGSAYLRAGQWERAVELMRGVLKRDPDSIVALNFLGYALADRGVELDEARRLLERARALRPSDGGVLDSLGWLEVKRGKLDEAERLLTRADRLAPGDPEILEHLGELYVRKSDRARALEAYRRALAHKPDEPLRRAVEQQILLLETGRVGSR